MAKIQILNKEGNKIKEVETILFEEPIRKDIILKVIESEKIRQPYSPKFRAGMDISASGNVTHRRKVWKSDRGKGISRIPKKTFWRRGTQFSWEGAIVPSTKGGRRAHPPKGNVNLKKINKKEMRKAFLSALSYISNIDELNKKYSSLERIETQLPLVVESSILQLNTKEFLDSLKKILGDFHNVAIQKKSIRAGIGKMRGRKYKRNAGLLFIMGDKEEKRINGIDAVNVSELGIGDLAENGARLTLFSETAIKEIEGLIQINEKENKSREKKKRVDKRKIKKEKSKKVKKTKKVNKVVEDKKK
jgi:large subunit ribosomal protein L4e